MNVGTAPGVLTPGVLTLVSLNVGTDPGVPGVLVSDPGVIGANGSLPCAVPVLYVTGELVTA
jgi:hypothetical protein